MSLRNISTISRIAVMDSSELKEIRQKLGFSQEELAKELKVAPNTVSRWELGNSRIPEYLGLALEAIQKKSTALILFFNSDNSEDEGKKVALFFLKDLKADLLKWELKPYDKGHKMELLINGYLDENAIKIVISLMRLSKINVSDWSFGKNLDSETLAIEE